MSCISLVKAFIHSKVKVMRVSIRIFFECVEINSVNRTRRKKQKYTIKSIFNINDKDEKNVNRLIYEWNEDETTCA